MEENAGTAPRFKSGPRRPPSVGGRLFGFFRFGLRRLFRYFGRERFPGLLGLPGREGVNNQGRHAKRSRPYNNVHGRVRAVFRLPGRASTGGGRGRQRGRGYHQTQSPRQDSNHNLTSDVKRHSPHPSIPNGMLRRKSIWTGGVRAACYPVRHTSGSGKRRGARPRGGDVGGEFSSPGAEKNLDISKTFS